MRRLSADGKEETFMGVDKYQVRGLTYYRIDEWITRSDGTPVRFRKKKIATKEQAMALVSKKKAEAFEGRFFDKVKTSTVSVADAWTSYEPISKRDIDTWRALNARAVHLSRHLRKKRAVQLTQADIDEYRNVRFGES